jgi:hypothetical protein
LRLHQHHGRLVAVLGLAADVAHRLVDQDGDLLALLLLGLAVDLDARVRGHGLAHHGGRAVHAHPAARDPVVGLAARAQAQLGHALVQAHSGRRRSGCGRRRGGLGNADGSARGFGAGAGFEGVLHGLGT